MQVVVKFRNQPTVHCKKNSLEVKWWHSHIINHSIFLCKSFEVHKINSVMATQIMLIRNAYLVLTCLVWSCIQVEERFRNQTIRNENDTCRLSSDMLAVRPHPQWNNWIIRESLYDCVGDNWIVKKSEPKFPILKAPNVNLCTYEPLFLNFLFSV